MTAVCDKESLLASTCLQLNVFIVEVGWRIMNPYLVEGEPDSRAARGSNTESSSDSLWCRKAKKSQVLEAGTAKKQTSSASLLCCCTHCSTHWGTEQSWSTDRDNTFKTTLGSLFKLFIDVSTCPLPLRFACLSSSPLMTGLMARPENERGIGCQDDATASYIIEYWWR